jgi:PKD repeat protein
MISVFNPPIADFNFTNNGCVTQPVSFLDNSTTGGRHVIIRYWDFGDGNTANTNNPVHTYSTAGPYPVRYALITDIGCLSDTIAHTVNLNDPPTALFSVPTQMSKKTKLLFQSPPADGATLVKWYWDFGDGSPQVIAMSGADQTHTLLQPVTLRDIESETATGCQSTVTIARYHFTQSNSRFYISKYMFAGRCCPVCQYVNH